MYIRRYGAIAACLAVLLVSVGVVAGVSAATNTLRIDPATTAVAQDATFSIKIIQNASVATSGAQATIVFDKAKLQVTTITKGAAWAAAPLFVGADAKAIAAANKSGKLKTVATAMLPPASVPAGDQEFISVEFKAIACGQVKLTLPIGPADATFLSGSSQTYGATVKASGTTGAVVTVCTGAGGASLPPDSGSSASPSDGSVDGASASPDPGPGASVDPSADPSGSVASDLPDPGGVIGASPSPSVLPGGTGGTGSSDCPSCSTRQEWLTFGLAALAVAAVGLALLIVLVLGALFVAGMVGLITFFRRRRATGNAPPPPAEPDSESSSATLAGPSAPRVPDTRDPTPG